MAYQALYRVFRPQRFADMVGQEHVTKTLQSALLQHKISHAYLFSGPRGTGKTSAAKISPRRSTVNRRQRRSHAMSVQLASALRMERFPMCWKLTLLPTTASMKFVISVRR
ncbi:DNA polymerase III subunit tau [Geobacillus sp. BCO2]|nr:DNA polymerase III subunit tau [Geobacillus sp. BCO2]